MFLPKIVGIFFLLFRIILLVCLRVAFGALYRLPECLRTPRRRPINAYRRFEPSEQFNFELRGHTPSKQIEADDEDYHVGAAAEFPPSDVHKRQNRFGTSSRQKSFGVAVAVVVPRTTIETLTESTSFRLCVEDALNICFTSAQTAPSLTKQPNKPTKETNRREAEGEEGEAIAIAVRRSEQR